MTGAERLSRRRLLAGSASLAWPGNAGAAEAGCRCAWVC